jgi:two-component system sensor histidine kinase AlgZ
MGQGLKHKFKIKRVLYTNTPLAAVIALLTYTMSSGTRPVDLLRYFFVAFVYSFFIGCLAHGAMPYIWAWSMPKRPLVRRSVAAVALTVLASAGCLVAGGFFVALGTYPRSQFWVFFRQSVSVSVLVSMIVGSFIITYESMKAQLQQTNLDLRTKELERERALKLATEARLSSLESRIHPHFLFNTLNSISSLIQEDPQRAERLIERIAALLRFSLDSGQAGLVPLHQEMKIVRDYLEIERARFGDRLRFEVDVPAELDHLEVPPLSIQTLVENSVKFAVAPRREGGAIRISAAKTASRIELKVWDDGPGFTIDSVIAGHGLDNLQARLLTLFNMEAALGMERTASGMLVRISMPQLAPK